MPGGKVAELTIGTDPDGYDGVLAWAQAHDERRGWSLEGAGGHGAGLARFRAAAGEVVVELDRPVGAARRHGAKSDPLDSVRAARRPCPASTWPSPGVRVPARSSEP